MRDSLQHVRSVVVKLGTQVLTGVDGRLDEAYLGEISRQIKQLRDAGRTVTLVSSGAIGAGMAALNLTQRPKDLPHLQAVAAVGQRRLMDAWALALAPHGLQVGQILLTREDIDGRKRFLNLRNTLGALHTLGVIPVINENDTISTDELVRITFGDNDLLAALVATALPADLLVLLSVVDGVLDSAGQPLRQVDQIDAATSLVRRDKSQLGKGGMNSKIEAARLVTRAGEMMIVAHGRSPEVLPRLLAGEVLGTLFLPRRRDHARGRSRWIDAARPAGTLHVDAGASAALCAGGKSLLPAGIVRIDGAFDRGDVVEVRGPDDARIARGLCNYAAGDLALILGRRTHEVRQVLGDRAFDEVIHRDNLVLGERPLTPAGDAPVEAQDTDQNR